MANPLLQFITNRVIQPAVDAEVAKAISDKQPVAYGVGTVPEVSLAQSIGQPHDADYALLYALYKLNTDVSGCVHKWAGGVTGAGWRITTMDPDAKLTSKLERQIEDVDRWLKNPNPYKLFESMLYELVQHFGIVGDSYWYVSEDKKGRPLEIWPMHPALTRIVATKQGEVLGYVMRSPGEEPVPFTADEVLHFPLPNPTNDLYGESPLELVVEEAGIDLQALRSNKAIFQNGLNPSAVILLDDTATPEQAKQLTDQLKQAHTGSANQHKLIAVSKAKDYRPSTLSPRDLEFLKLRDLATSKVTTAYRIPKVLLGHHNAGDYATTKFLIRDTYNHVYRPMQRLIEAIITERLIHRFNPELRFELLPPDPSDPDDIRKDQMAAKRDGILTADEVRGDAFGKDPLETHEQETPTNDETKPDTDAGDTAEEAPDTAKSVTKARGVSEAEQSLLDAREDTLDALADPLETPIIGFFSSQEARYLSRLDSSETVSKSLDSSGLDEFLNDPQADTLLSTLLQSLLYPALIGGAEAAQLQIGISLSFAQTNPLIERYLETEALAHAQGINDTTRKELRLTLQEGLQADEGTPELSKRVQNVFAEAKGYRATLIARNEVNQAYAYGNHAALAETGVVARRKWLTAGDGRVRPAHAALNGVIVDFDDPFPTGIEPGSEINCRCQEIGIVDD